MTSDEKGVEQTSPTLDSAALFSQLDTNQDGRLDASELKVDHYSFPPAPGRWRPLLDCAPEAVACLQAVLKALGLPHTDSYLSDIYRQYDANHDGMVDLVEFQQYIQRQEAAMQRAFRRARRMSCLGAVVLGMQRASWQLSCCRYPAGECCDHACRSLDRDHSGRISQDELRQALSALGVPVDAELAAKMIEIIDVDHSADISYEEFRRFAALLPQSQVAALPYSV